MGPSSLEALWPYEDNGEWLLHASSPTESTAEPYAYRIGKWKRTGLIWWNILDGCPQFSDAVVDYYFNKKLACHYIKQSQQRVCMMFDEPADGQIALFVANDTMEDQQLRYRVTDLKDGSVIGEGEVLCRADTSEKKASFPEAKENTVWLIEWTVNGRTCRNHYACGPAPFDADEYVHLMQKAGFDVSVS